MQTTNGSGRSAAARRGTTYARGDVARARILTVAWDAFAARGFRGTSFNEIAKAAGLTMPGLIHHFPSKADLFAAVLATREADDYTRLHSIIGENPDGFQVLDAFVEFARTNAGRYSFVQLSHLIAAESAPGDHPGTASTREHFRRSRQMLADALDRSIATGQIDEETDPHLVALQVVAMIEGLENQWLHDPDTIDLAGVFASWVADLKNRLRPS